MNKNQHSASNFVPILIYTVIACFSIRKLLDSLVSIGHNWDSPFSDLTVSYSATIKSIPYVWLEHLSLGTNGIPALSNKIWWFLNSVYGLILGGVFVSQSRIILSMVIGAFLIYWYVLLLLPERPKRSRYFAPFYAGLFFMLSPLYLGHFIGGVFSQLDAMIVNIILLIILHKGTKTSNLNHPPLLIGIISIFISISLQNLVFALLFILAYILFLYPLKFKNKIIFLTKTLISIILFNIYWILPLFQSLKSEPVSQRLNESLSLSNIKNNVPSLSNALFANGYIRPFYNYLVVDNLSVVWKVTALLLVATIFIGLFFIKSKKKTKKIIYFWFAIYLFSLIFATGFNSPLKELVIFLYTHFPPMALFRSPQWLMMPLTIAFSVILGLATFQLTQKFSYKIIYPLFLILILFITHPFYISGDLGTEKLYQKALSDPNWYNADHLDNYQTPADYEEAINYLSNTTDDSGVLLLPLSGSPYYLQTDYQREGAGVDPILVYAPPKPMIFSDLYTDYNGLLTISSLEKKIYKENSLDFLNNLGIFNAGYILFKKDYAPVYSPYGYRQYWDNKKVYQLLKDNLDLIADEVIVDGESTLLLKLKPQYTLPHIYIPEQNIYLEGNVSQISNIKLADETSPPGFYFNQTKTSNTTSLLDTNSSVSDINFSQLFITPDPPQKDLLDPSTSYVFFFNIPQTAIYQIFLKTTPSTSWQLLEEKQFEAGDRQYVYQDIKEKKNLLSQDGAIESYQPDTAYQVSLDYKTLDDGQGFLTIIENNQNKVLNYPLSPYAPNHIGHFRSSFEGQSAKLITTNLEVEKIKINPIPDPELLLISQPITITKPDFPQISYTKINPTLYKVKVSNVSSPYTVIFSETFHPDWQVYIASDTSILAQVARDFFFSPIAKDDHQLINGYANAWRVSPKDADNQTDYELIIQFRPQSWFYLGLFISITTLIISSIYLLKTKKSK